MSETTTEKGQSRVFDIAKDFEDIETLRAEIGELRQQLEPLLNRLAETERVWRIIGGIPVASFYSGDETRYWVVGAGEYRSTVRTRYGIRVLMLGEDPLKTEEFGSSQEAHDRAVEWVVSEPGLREGEVDRTYPRNTLYLF